MENNVTTIEPNKAEQSLGKKILKGMRKWGFILLAILTPIVLLHEAAHMLTALAFGMTVETYNVGFGPSLFQFEAGGIVYHWRLILLGGYVSIAPNMSTFPLWQQLLVMFAGCAINLLTFIVIAKLFIRNWWVWCKTAWGYMIIEIWNILLKTFFISWRSEPLCDAESFMNYRWTRFSSMRSHYIMSLAFISVNLGLFNLIPFVGVLDGGKITSLLLTPLLGAPMVTKITTMLLNYVLIRWGIWEYMAKPLVSAIYFQTRIASGKKMSKHLLEHQVITQKQLDFLVKNTKYKKILQYLCDCLEESKEEARREKVELLVANHYPDEHTVQNMLLAFAYQQIGRTKINLPNFGKSEEDKKAIEELNERFREKRLQEIMAESGQSKTGQKALGNSQGTWSRRVYTLRDFFITNVFSPFFLHSLQKRDLIFGIVHQYIFESAQLILNTFPQASEQTIP